MNRRSFLLTSSTVGTLLLAGCTTPDKTSEPDPDNITERPKITTVTSALPENVTVEVELIEPNHSEKPLDIGISLINNSETDYTYGEARDARFIGASDGKFSLYPREQYDSDDTYRFDSETEVWVAKQGFMQTMEYRMETLEAGETHNAVLRLLHQKPNENEVISQYPDELNFDVEFKMAESQNDLLTEESGQTVRAAFSLLPPQKSD